MQRGCACTMTRGMHRCSHSDRQTDDSDIAGGVSALRAARAQPWSLPHRRQAIKALRDITHRNLCTSIEEERAQARALLPRLSDTTPRGILCRLDTITNGIPRCTAYHAARAVHTHACKAPAAKPCRPFGTHTLTNSREFGNPSLGLCSAPTLRTAQHSTATHSSPHSLHCAVAFRSLQTARAWHTSLIRRAAPLL